jgi:hypothetical protein
LKHAEIATTFQASAEEIFTSIYTKNTWGGSDSHSGTGSDLYQTRRIAKAIPALCARLGVSRLLDIPCGDFHWMSTVDLGRIDYTGADIVDDLIRLNRERYARPGVRFDRINLITDPLPRVDLVFCRDCLVHLPQTDVFAALQNVCRSGAEYLLTTTFTGSHDNEDVPTGGWRPLNLELAPFELPEPLVVINEGCTEGHGYFVDKSLGLWRVADIRASLA